MPVSAPPDCAEPLARVGPPLVAGGMMPTMLTGG
jgi:hypothetical protein